MMEARERIFGSSFQAGNQRTGRKVLSQITKGTNLLKWYNREIESFSQGPFYTSVKSITKVERRERRKLRGKEPTKKGMGKMAMRRKKEEMRIAAKQAKNKK